MSRRLVGQVLVLAFAGGPSLFVSLDAQTTGIREVSASSRSLIPLQTRLRYTTMVVLPEGEEILDVICGDKDFWVISSTHNIAHVKPAKEGATTNLNLVTASGAVYSFLLSEKSGTSMPDLKVYVTADPSEAQVKPKYYSAAQVEELQAALAKAKAATVAATEAANRRATDSIAAYHQQYPATLQFVYGTPRYAKPFLVRSMWHDGKFTYIKSDATELPALYEMKDGKPAVVNFQVHDGTYVVPKVLDEGYLALGKDHFPFSQQGR
jgi:type IV secretory pathway VirB9-like protein